MAIRSYQQAFGLSSITNIAWQRNLIIIFGFLACVSIGASLAVENYTFALVSFAFILALIICVFPYLGILLFLILTYARPQDYVAGIMGRPVILWLMSLTFGAWLIRLLALRQREFVKAPQTYLFVALMLVATLSSSRTWLVYAKDSLIELLKITLMYFLMVNLVNTRAKFAGLLWVMFAGTIYIALLGIFQHYGIAPGIAGVTPENNLGRIQGFGIFDNPNYLAYGVAFMIPFAIYSFYYSRLWPVKLISILTVPAIFVPCIWFTRSRGGLLCMAITIMSCVFQDRKPKIALLGVLIGAGAIFILLNTIPILGTVTTYQDDASAMGRVEAWRAGFGMLLSSPLLGVGYGLFQENWARDSHNSFVEVGSELGLLGLFVWLGLIYWSYKYLRATVQHILQTEARKQLAYVKSLKATTFAYIGGSLFASLGYYMLIYIFHSLAVVAGQLYLPEEKKREISRIGLKDLAIIGGAELGVLCVWFAFPRL